MGIKTNISEVIKQWEKFEKEAARAANRAMDKHIALVFKETQVRVPKKTTALMRTGRTEKNETVGGAISRSIWYGEPGEGDGVIDYAAAVHEILHAKHLPPTSAKYVESPLAASVGEAEKIVAAEYEKAVKKAFK